MRKWVTAYQWSYDHVINPTAIRIRQKTAHDCQLKYIETAYQSDAAIYIIYSHSQEYEIMCVT